MIKALLLIALGLLVAFALLLAGLIIQVIIWVKHDERNFPNPNL